MEVLVRKDSDFGQKFLFFFYFEKKSLRKREPNTNCLQSIQSHNIKLVKCEKNGAEFEMTFEI